MTETNGNGHHHDHDDEHNDDDISPLMKMFEDLAKDPERLKATVSPMLDGFGKIPPYVLHGLAAALTAHAHQRAVDDAAEIEPLTAAEMWSELVNEQLKNSDTDFFVASVALKGIGDIGFGPVKRLPGGLLVLGVVGKGVDNKPSKMDRHFTVDDIAMLGIVQVAVEPPKSSIIQ